MTETRKLLEKLRDKLKDYAPIMWADDIAEIDAHLASGGWIRVDEYPSSISWVDSWAQYVGKYRNGRRYIYPLPALPKEGE